MVHTSRSSQFGHDENRIDNLDIRTALRALAGSALLGLCMHAPANASPPAFVEHDGFQSASRTVHHSAEREQDVG